MTIGFTMVTYIAVKIGHIIKFLLANPFAALAIGIIATVNILFYKLNNYFYIIYMLNH